MFHLRHCRDASLPNKPTSLQTPPLHFRQILPWADQLLCFCNSFHYIIMKSWKSYHDETWWNVPWARLLSRRCSTCGIADSPLAFFNTFVVIWRSFSTFVDKKWRWISESRKTASQALFMTFNDRSFLGSAGLRHCRAIPFVFSPFLPDGRNFILREAFRKNLIFLPQCIDKEGKFYYDYS